MLSIAQIKGLFPKAAAEHVAAFLTLEDTLFAEYGLNKNPNRLHFFLAQIGHESSGLTNERENMNYSAARMMAVWPSRFPTETSAAPFANAAEKLGNFVYANRNGNGPQNSGDGFRFRGRGYMQLTGREGYAQVGRIVRLDLVSNPDLACLPDHALKVALGFWRWKNANAVCDTGDFRQTTLTVNGGLTNMADRTDWLDRVRHALAPLPPPPPPPPPKPVTVDAVTIIKVQNALIALGGSGLTQANGVFGPKTAAAVSAYRAKKKLAPGGIDAALLKSLGLS